MATFTGKYETAVSVAAIIDAKAPPAPQGSFGVPGYWSAIYALNDLGCGPRRHVVPDFLPQHFTGYMENSYFSMYYNRLWLLPTTVDFGSITADVYRDVYIWNAHMRPTTITEILHPDDSSVGISEFTVPKYLRALGSATMRVEAKGDGDPTVDATFTFLAEPTETTRLRVIGNRSRLWEFPPNWNEPYEITLELKTEIITSYSGKEQRIALRQEPRKSYSFSTLVHDERFRRFCRYMNAWQQRSAVMPEYSRVTNLAQPIVDGSITCYVTEVPRWLTAGRLISFMDGTRHAVRSVRAISGNMLTLGSAMEGFWRAGVRVFAAETGRLASNIAATQHTNLTSTVGVTFNVSPGSDYWPETLPPEREHRGREVMLKRPNWGTPPAPEFTSVLDAVDYGVGVLDYFTPVNFNTRVHKAEYIGVNNADVDQYIDFFRRQLGQQGEFYMPTFTHDLPPKGVAPAGSVNLRIAGTDTFEDYGESTIYRDFAVLMKNGQILTRRIVSIYIMDDENGRDTAIQTDEAFPDDVSAESVRQICWMPLWRLLSDSIVIQHVTTEVANISLNMKTLEYGEAE